MPHIIFLLLIASSPFYTLGDETASWGNIQSGPSESECRPFIEKALQGASIPDSLDDPRDTDDVGENEQQEEDATITEASDVPPDLPEQTEVNTEQSEENETLETGSNEENIQPVESVESAEVHLEDEEISQEKSETVQNEDTADSGGSQEINNNEQQSQEVLSDEQNNDSNVIIDEKKQSDEESTEETISETTPEYETESETSQEGGEETYSKSVEEPESEANKKIEVESIEEIETEIPNESESEPDTLIENNEADIIDASKEKAESESDELIEDLNKDNIIEQVEQDHSNETEREESLGVAKENDTGSISEESENTDDSIEQVTETNQGSEEMNQEIVETLSEEATDKIIEETSGEGVLEKEINDELTLVSNEKVDLEEPSDDLPISSDETEDQQIVDVPHDSGSRVDTVESVDVEDVGHSSQEKIEGTLEEKQEETLDFKEESTVEETTHEGDVPTEEATPEEELSMLMEIPEHLRSREHMAQILRLNIENEEIEKGLAKIAESTLRELKKLYDVAIKPLEILYKYRDLSNRHFGDPEIFSKPLILFMGPWSGGKSTIINYLLENEYKKTALRTGAEPSPAYFNIVMRGDFEEVLDGTQLAADWTFSGLQKFGQGLLDRLRGLKLNHPLLEKVNIVEIPGILEIRKQVERLFPFNDACQWFIDRADIIFLVYDPSKLDVGPETEAILDQLKGREMQTRIILNKADQVKPEELMRVQGTLIWNISPLMSSTEPPIMYSTSLWSIPYESGAPTRLLHAQERAFLKDLRDAVDKRVENKIASARRFAVRVRNHAKMVDCYLTTYYNHKSFFGNKKRISDDIIEHPQNYHIYEGLSTLTNISRYDLPDPDVYRDFFRLNPVYEFQQLSATCTYFRGCPINRLDVAIAYDLPELVGKYKKNVEEIYSHSKK